MHLKRVDLHPERYPTREHYPFNLDIFHETRSILFDSPVTFFVGENGTGKSTLLEALTHKCGIYIWGGIERRRFKVNLYEQRLWETIDVEWSHDGVRGSFFSSQAFRNYAQIVDEWAAADPKVFEYFGGKSLVTQSHGQSIMSFFKARFKIKGIYFMDEPETALSPKTQLDLVRLLKDMSQAGHAQFIIATHSPILMACPDARIYSFDHIPVKHIDYEDTEQFQVYKSFIEDRNKFLDGNH
ncbi:MAG: AAA family ATPase [Thermodesulfobacteriota bacterium]|nr:AAA family ATPase [Thermodesulfobacteriota bacterium]